jgi:glycosyltransferase involved in cell wall biosynthesis
MHIGLITSDLSTGNGWATYSLSLIQSLHRQGIQTTVVCSHNTPPTDFDIHPILPSVTPPERNTFLKTLRQVRTTKALLADCDIIHSTVEPFAILADWVAGSRPLFVTAHGSYVNLPRMRRFPMNYLYRWAFERATLMCVSRYTATVARDIVPNVSTQVINNGVDVTRFLDVPALPQAKTAPTIVTAGQVKPRKGTLQLVEAVAVVRETIPDVQCLIMGNPQIGSRYHEQVQSAISRHGLEDNVHLLGFVDDELMRAWFGAADVVVLPSINEGFWFEGFGLVLVEASASGTAVIGTDNCGVADAVVHGETGLVISQENITSELPAALLELLTHPEQAHQMGENGRVSAQTRTWDSVASQLIASYQNHLAPSNDKT